MIFFENDAESLLELLELLLCVFKMDDAIFRTWDVYEIIHNLEILVFREEVERSSR